MARIVEQPYSAISRDRHSLNTGRLQPWELTETPISGYAHLAKEGIYIKNQLKRISGHNEHVVEQPEDESRRIPVDRNQPTAVGETEFINRTSQEKPRLKLINLDRDPIQIITLPWIPETISMDPVSRLVAIPSVGRNLPFYHYTGSEDTLEFVIDWFFTDDRSRKQAMTMATWVESFSKTDGYSSSLPRIKLVCGDLFRDSIWLVEHAPYTIRRFSATLLDQLNKDEYEIIKHELLPQQVTQEIVLKRVGFSLHEPGHNPGTKDIVYQYEKTKHMSRMPSIAFGYRPERLEPILPPVTTPPIPNIDKKPISQ